MSDQPDNPELHITPEGQDGTRPPAESNPVDEAYGTEARQMLKAIRLPESGPLSGRQRTQVCQTVKAHAKKNKLTYREIGRQVGYRDSVICDTLNGKYRGDIDAVVRKLNAWVDDDERRRQRMQPLGFYETSVFRTIRDAAVIAKSNARTVRTTATCDDRSRIVVATGPSGCGKSVGARALHAFDPNSILIRIRQKAGTDSGVARLIVESAGWRGRPPKQGAIEFVVEKLHTTGRLLIVDEAHRLSNSGYELIRDLADECGIPILLLGTDRVRQRVESTRMGIANMLDDQFSRRVCWVADLLRGADGRGGKARPIYSIAEIVEIFKSDKVRLTDDGAEFLCAVACTVGIGMLGMAANIYEKAAYAARRRDNVVDAAILRLAAKRVLLPAGFSADDRVDDDPIMRQIESSLGANRGMKVAAG